MSEEESTFRPELLVLIEERPEAQRLLVTWNKAWGLYSELDFHGSDMLPEFKENDDFTTRWAQISDVDPLDIEKLCPVLFVNELLWPEGGVDTVAIGWVKARMMEMMGTSLG